MREIFDVECLICNKVFNSTLNTHIKRMHGISTKEYREKFNLSKKDLMTTEYLRNKSERTKLLHKTGKITKKMVKKAFGKLKDWKKTKEAEDFFSTEESKKRFERGRKKQLEYWTKEKRENKSKFSSNEMKKRWKNKEYRKKAKARTDDFIRKRKLNSLEFRSLSKKCPNCQIIYHPVGSSSRKIFDKKIFCKQSCKDEYMRKNKWSVTEFSKHTEELRNLCKNT